MKKYNKKKCFYNSLANYLLSKECMVNYVNNILEWVNTDIEIKSTKKYYQVLLWDNDGYIY